MSEWYQRQFGDRGVIALCASLGVDPHPSGETPLDLSWGSLEIWVRNRCLTATMSDGGLSKGNRWNLLPVLQWLLDVGIRLVNEDPYPRFSKGTDVGDGSAWFDATLSPPVLSAEAEGRWFLRRSEWRHHHALRRAAEDVALPNVVFKREGDQVEVSWDNDAWAPPRPDLYFVEKRGRELVPAPAFAAVVGELLVDVLAGLAARTSNPQLRELSEAAAGFTARDTDWRWLVHRPTAEVIRDQLPELRERLDEATRTTLAGLYVPHTPETMLLRQVRLESRAEIEALLRPASPRTARQG